MTPLTDAVACGSGVGMRWARVTFAVLLCVVAVPALILLTRQVASLLEFVTIGPIGSGLPGSAEGIAVPLLFERAGLRRDAFVGREVVIASAAILAIAVAVLWTRTSRRFGVRVANIMAQAALGMAVLGVSYRFLGLVGFVCAMIWQVWRPPARVAWVLWGVSAVVCLLPVDVTVRDFVGTPRMVETVPCSTGRAYQAYAAGTMAYVCVDWGQSLYNAPSKAWVW